MASSQFVSEEILHAFVDGETDAQTNTVVLAYLSTSPVDSARVETWRSQNELIRTSFAKAEHEPIPLSLSLTPNRNPRTDALLQLVPDAGSTRGRKDSIPPSKTGDLTRLCVALGIAFAGGMIAALVTPHITRPISELLPNQFTTLNKSLADTGLPSQTLEIAALQEKPASPSADSLKDVTLSPQSSHEDLNPAPALIRDLAVLGLSLKSFQIGAAPNPALCLFLMTKAGEALTLCKEAATGQTGRQGNSNFRLTKAHALSAVDWAEKTEHFALAGSLPEASMFDLSRRIHAQIEASDQKP